MTAVLVPAPLLVRRDVLSASPHRCGAAPPTRRRAASATGTDRPIRRPHSNGREWLEVASRKFRSTSPYLALAGQNLTTEEPEISDAGLTVAGTTEHRNSARRPGHDPLANTKPLTFEADQPWLSLIGFGLAGSPQREKSYIHRHGPSNRSPKRAECTQDTEYYSYREIYQRIKTVNR